MRRLLLIITLLCSLEALISQSVINVSSEYTYYAPSDISIEEAKRIASQYENAGGFDFSMFENGTDPTATPTYKATENVDEY